MPVDPAALAASISRLSRGPREDVDPVDLLQQIVDAADRIFNLSGFAIMFTDEGDALRYVAATDESIRALERAQEEAGEGPCFDSLVLDAVVTCADLAADERYPSVAAAVVPLGIRAVLGVPVRLGGAPVATLNVYRDKPHAWEVGEVEAMLTFARLIETLLLSLLTARRHSALVDQLQYALDHRVVIERGVGYVMAAQQLDPVAAFDVLRRAARGSRRKIAEVAAEMLAGHAAEGARPR